MVGKRKNPLILSQLFMLVLALISILLLFYEVYSGLNITRNPAYTWLDYLICGFFLIDFLYHRTLSKRKKSFVGRHWIELLAAIPLVGYPGAGLMTSGLIYGFSILHLLRLLRLFIRIRILLDASTKFTRHSYLVYVFTIVAFIVLSGAGAFYLVEYGINPNLHTYNDAIWWAIVTVTSVGYGDIFPVTQAGRIIAVVVMLTGLAALGTLLALIESMILKRK